jgi:hypothetical protein
MLDFKTGVEVGVANGEYSKLICDLNPQMKLYGIDPWTPYKDYIDFKKHSTFKMMEEETLRRMRKYIKEGQYEIIKEFSIDAVKRFEDKSLDFVYIDANHEGDYALIDVTAWAKKVKSGGIVAGHDFYHSDATKIPYWSVKGAIKTYVKNNNIQPLIVLGSNEKLRCQVREVARSWLFIKP